MNKILISLLLLVSFTAFSQDKPKFIYVDFTDKSVSLTPFYKVFGSSIDPAVTLGGGIEYFQKSNSTIFQVVQATGYSTQMIGNGLTLSTSIAYRYSLQSGLFAEIMLGLGGSGFFPSKETFSLDENDQYSAVKPFHSTLGVPIDLLAGYRKGAYSFYLKYWYMVEGTYTDILPMLPTSLTGFGVRYTLEGKSN